MTQPEPLPPPIPRAAKVAIGGLTALVVVLVGLTLRAREVPVFGPTAIGGAAPVGAGPHQVTVDASNPERWTHLSLARGSVVAAPGPLDWDLAFRRFEVRVNGGAGERGQGGALDLGAVALDSVTAAPETGYVGMEAAGRDTTETLLNDWYGYSYTSHLLEPRDRTYALRTADGRRVALRFLSYYCPGAQPGCVTLRYRFLDSVAAPTL